MFAKKRGLSRKPGPPVHDDLVQRDFTADRLDELWFTDLTEHPTGEGKLYLCAFKDACSTRIVGYSMGPRMTAELAVSALRNAVALRDPHGTVVVHSDRGSHPLPGSSSGPSTTPASPARWAGSPRALTTPPWKVSSHCSKRTSSTANAGKPEKNSASPSSPGSKGPTIDAAANDASADSLP